MNTIGYFEIQADDTGQAAKFYASVFGWTLTEEPNLPIKYRRIETGGSRGGLLERPAPTPPSNSGTNAFINSIEVENFDRTSELILASGGRIALTKFAVAGGCWQGYFLDNQNNTFGIFEPDETAGRA